MSPSSSRAPEPAGRLKHLWIRHATRLLASCYLRVRLTGLDRLPRSGPYLLNFSHPNWVDPFLLISFWPEPPRLYIFGPRQEDMTKGWKNRLIAWSRIGVHFKPSKSDLLDTTRRAMAVLDRGDILAIAGEGRLSDREGAIVPLQDGAAFFALRGKVPIVPLAIIGTRWLRFGKRIEMRTGSPIATDDLRPNRQGVAVLTERLQEAMEQLLAGVGETPPPGPFGRWVTDVFNDRPWLTEQAQVKGDRKGAGVSD